MVGAGRFSERGGGLREGGWKFSEERGLRKGTGPQEGGMEAQ